MILSPICVDNREKDPPYEIRIMELKNLGHSAFLGQLPVGDYMWWVKDADELRTQVVLERKSIQDFIASMPPDARLSRFVQETGGARPAENTVRAMLLEGTDIPERSGWDEDSLDAKIVSLQALGVIIVRSKNAAHSAKRIAQFYEWTGKDECKLFLVPVLPQTRRNYSPGRFRAVRTIMALDGFGEERALQALRKLGSSGAVLKAILEENQKAFKTVPDVGPVTVKKAHDQLWRQVYATDED